MSNILYQLTLTYSAKQDRVMLRISTKEHNEYQFWLTRRFIHVVWQSLVKAVEHNPTLSQGLMPKIKKAVMAMEHQEAIQGSDFSKKHSSDNVNLTPKMSQNFSQNKSEDKVRTTSGAKVLLITGAQVKPANGDLTWIKLKTEANTAIEFSLNKKLLHALCHMMVSSTQKAGWDLNLAIGDSQVVIPTNANQIH